MKWERLNPVEGFKRVFSGRSLVPTGISLMKLTLIALLTYSQVKQLLADPIFYTAVDVARIGQFLAEAAFGITWRVVLGLTVLAGLDYSYQFWRTNRDLMMTRDEEKEEMKSTEGNPQIKARPATSLGAQNGEADAPGRAQGGCDRHKPDAPGHRVAL